jgi:hypothetical protein
MSALSVEALRAFTGRHATDFEISKVSKRPLGERLEASESRSYRQLIVAL